MDKLVFHVFSSLGNVGFPCVKNSIGRFLELSGQKVNLISIEMKVSVI